MQAKIHNRRFQRVFLGGQDCFGLQNTNKKENKILLINKEIQMWSSYKVIYEGGLPNI
jgi:hypothetical protein